MLRASMKITSFQGIMSLKCIMSVLCSEIKSCDRNDIINENKNKQSI